MEPNPSLRLPTLSEQLYDMAVHETRVFADANPNTIRRTAVRLKEHGRKFTCKAVPGGYQVWRLA